VKRIGPWSAFRTGFARCLQQWPLWLLFCVVLVAVSGLLLWPLERTLAQAIGHRLAAGEIARGIPGWLAAETLRQVREQPDRFAAPLATAGLTFPAWPFLMALPFGLLSAGALPLYAAAGRRTDWRLFGRGLGRWAGSFALLLLLEVVLFELSIFLLLALTAVVLVATRGTALWVLILTAPILAAVIVLIPWWFEYARALAVVQQERHVFHLLGTAWGFLFRNLGPAAGLALFNFLLPILPTLLYLLLTLPLPSSWWVGRVFIQQLFVFGLIGTRLVRLASEVCLVQGRGKQARQEGRSIVESAAV